MNTVRSINEIKSLTSVYVTPLPAALTEFNWHTLVQDILPGEWQLMNNWASKKADMKDIPSYVSGFRSLSSSSSYCQDMISDFAQCCGGCKKDECSPVRSVFAA
ncbi:hypothetical protein BD769DRAFT_1427191 [Suillus cothurnatus]|nr:hypothetical protein BD769DRAFT_1427191 [Suillus cothurnatus]